MFKNLGKMKTPRYVGHPCLEVLEGANNYNSWIASNFLSKLNPPVLEIGSGTGNISKHFLKKVPLHISEVDPYFLSLLRKRFKNDKEILIEKLDITKNPPQEYNLFSIQ